jgi:glutamine cyclotransferase
MTFRLTTLMTAALCSGGALPALAETATKEHVVAELRYEVVNTFPHDRGAFTQGLLYRDGFLYESTGLHGRSGVRKVVLETGTVIQQRSLEKEYFGEGLADWNGTLIQLTWQNRIGFVFDLDTLEPTRSFGYEGEGWGLTHDGRRLIMSDGTPALRFLDPETLRETGRVDVTYEGKPLPGLNELEMIDDAVFANVWGSQWIVRIDPDSGRVTGRMNLSGLLPAEERGRVDVLNGIAWDAEKRRLFVTGKLWPALFEIRLIEPAAQSKDRPGDHTESNAANTSQSGNMGR